MPNDAGNGHSSNDGNAAESAARIGAAVDPFAGLNIDGGNGNGDGAIGSGVGSSSDVENESGNARNDGSELPNDDAGLSDANQRDAGPSSDIGNGGRNAASGRNSGTENGFKFDDERGTTKGTRNSREDIPRRVNFSDVKDDETAPVSSTEMIEDSIQFVYWMCSHFGGDHWMLNESEVEVLSKRVQVLIQHAGKRKSKRILKTMDKYLPGASLAFAASMITYPRIIDTLNARKRVQRNDSPIQERGSRRGGSGNENRSENSAEWRSNGYNSTSQRSPSRYYGDPSSIRAVPLTADDFDKLFDPDAIIIE